MVREHHDLVAARRRVGHLLPQPHDPVEALERPHRLRTQRTRVVRDLVVVDQVHEHHGRTAQELLGDERGVEVAEHDVRHGPQHRVGAQPGDTRHDVAHGLLPALVQLLEELPHGRHQGPDQDERAREEVDEQLPRSQSRTSPAHDEQVRRGVPREHGRHRDAVVREQPAAVAHERLDLCGVRRAVGHDQTTLRAVPPPERRHVLARAVQQTGLARGRGRGHPGPPRLELVRPRAQPPGQVRRQARLDRVVERLARHPVELHDQQTRPGPARRVRPGPCGPCGACTPCRPPVRAPPGTAGRSPLGPARSPQQMVDHVLVVARPHRPAPDRHEERREHQHGHDRAPVVGLEAGQIGQREPRHDHLAHEARDQRPQDTCTARDHPPQRTQHRVARTDDESREDHRPPRRDAHPGDEPDRDGEPRRRRHEGPQRPREVVHGERETVPHAAMMPRRSTYRAGGA